MKHDAMNVDATGCDAPFRITDVDERTGRGVVAARFIPAQAPIFCFAPDIVVLYSSHAGKLCASCFASVTLPTRRGAFVCPRCDQFVLCARCATASRTCSEVADSDRPGTMSLSAMRVHRLVCGWYNELPASVRAPGLDTDFLRFCLLYGARVALGDDNLRRAIHTLNDYRQVLPREYVDFSEAFSRDKIIGTFGPTQRGDASQSTRMLQRRRDGSQSDAHSASTASTQDTMRVHHNYDNNDDAHIDAEPTPRYPVSSEELKGVLLRTRCNSFGFPFNKEEATGWALHETFCLLNHSCVPNAAVVMVEDDENMAVPTADTTRVSVGSGCDGAKETQTPRRGWMRLNAIRDIQPNEEITISYVDMETYGSSVRERQRYLLERYRFLCRCPLCQQQIKELAKTRRTP